MAIGRHLLQHGRLRLARRLGRSFPVLGAALALFAIRRAVRQKGFRGGVTDTALDATPVLGAVKNVFEAARGRDIIPDRMHVR
jgi:hypothetical protein